MLPRVRTSTRLSGRPASGEAQVDAGPVEHAGASPKAHPWRCTAADQRGALFEFAHASAR